MALEATQREIMGNPLDKQPLELTDEEWALLAAFSEADAIRAQQDANKHTRRNLLILGFILLSMRRARPVAQTVTPAGQPLPELTARQVRNALDKYIDGTSGDMRALADLYRGGGLRLTEWELRMIERIKATHYGAAALQRGGYANLTRADILRLEDIIRGQLDYLRKFGQDIGGGLPLDGRFIRRAEMYGRAGRGTYYEFARDEVRRLGATEEMNVIRRGDNCRGCIAQTARGWVPLGTLVPIGQRDCLANCRCSLSYRDTMGNEYAL